MDGTFDLSLFDAGVFDDYTPSTKDGTITIKPIWYANPRAPKGKRTVSVMRRT
jgi:hypothetical protein